MLIHVGLLIHLLQVKTQIKNYSKLLILLHMNLYNHGVMFLHNIKHYKNLDLQFLIIKLLIKLQMIILINFLMNKEKNLYMKLMVQLLLLMVIIHVIQIKIQNMHLLLKIKNNPLLLQLQLKKSSGIYLDMVKLNLYFY